MPTLVYLEQSFDCAIAIKGDDYIRLLDDNGCLTASFDGISDFSLFTLQDGEYTPAAPDSDCYLAVIRDDGTVGKGGHKCSDLSFGSNLVAATIGTSWTGSEAPFTQTIAIDGVTESCVVEIALPSTATADEVAAFQGLSLQDGGQTAGSITLKAFGSKNEINVPINVIVRRDL